MPSDIADTRRASSVAAGGVERACGRPWFEHVAASGASDGARTRRGEKNWVRALRNLSTRGREVNGQSHHRSHAHDVMASRRPDSERLGGGNRIGPAALRPVARPAVWVGRLSTRRLCRHVHRTHSGPPPIQRRTRTSRLADPLARHLVPVDGVEVADAPGTPASTPEHASRRHCSRTSR